MSARLDANAFAGRRIALPETRQLDVLANLLLRRGAEVVRCPLISMHDHPDQAAVGEWLDRFLADPRVGDLVILTGESIARLDAAAERFGRQDAFRERLAETRLIVRGPKPGRVLKHWGLSPDLVAERPTSAGAIASLQRLADPAAVIGVAMYGTEPNRPLIEAIEALGAEPLPVWPYVYASESENEIVLALIERLIDGEIDAIAFTSQPQIDRLLRVARNHELETALREALAERTTVTAIGPVMANRLTELGIGVDVMPEGRYFMKPLVDALASHLQGPGNGTGDDRPDAGPGVESNIDRGATP